MKRRLQLSVEAVLLFVALPFLAWAIGERIIIAGLLWAACVGAGLWLYKNRRHCLFVRPASRDFAFSCLRVALCVIALFLFTYWLLPDRLWSFPREKPLVFGLVACLYPFLSALPQEILYRAFFFARYESLFPSERLRIWLSAAAFALGHVMFGNWIALILSFVGGLMFAHVYARTKSLGLVCFEHAVLGVAIFALGLGWYFYLGAGHQWLNAAG